MRVIKAGIGRKIPLDRITLGPTGTWEQVEDSKGGGAIGRRKSGMD